MKPFTCVMLVACGDVVLSPVYMMHLPVLAVVSWYPNRRASDQHGKKTECNVDWPICLGCLS